MKKRALSLLMSLVMLISMLPTTAWAVDTTETTTPTTVNVDFTAQAAGKFLIPPQFNVAVSSDEAEKFGYTDSVDGVSALDVLVKANEIMFGDAFTSETKDEYLVVPASGFASKLFGIETDANGFILNGGYANDGTESQSGGYNGTTVTTQVVSNGDRVEFFCYQDQMMWGDELAWFCQNGGAVDHITIKPSGELKLTLKSVSYMAGYLYKDVETLHLAGTSASDAQLAWVDKDGKLADIDGAVTDENGAVTITVPDKEETYYLTAYRTNKGIEAGKAPLVISLTPVVVDKNAPGPCDLISLDVTNFDANPSALVLSPTFTGSVSNYSVETLPFSSAFTASWLYVRATAVSETAKITAECNGVATSVDSNWKLMMSALHSGDNLLTITVTNGDQSKVYKVTIPMAADPAAPVLVGDKTATATVKKGGSYTLDLTKVFAKGTSDADLTYQVSVDGQTAVETSADYRYAADAAGVHKLVFTAKSGSLTSPTYTVTVNVQPETDLVMHKIAAKYAASGVVQDGNSYWLAADMMAYEKTFPDSANKLTQEQKQAMMELAVKTIETSSSAGDLAKSIIALTAMGYDATKITTDSGAALDGVAKLAAMVNDENKSNVSIYNVGFVMIALQQFGDTYQAELDKLTAYALEQKSGWMNTSWGPDTMAFVMTALAPYAETNADVKTALDEAVTVLAKCQNEVGSVGNGSSNGLSIVAVTALGMDPATFNGKSLVDGLMSNVLTSEDGFDSTENSFGTEQGFRGLIALANHQEGKSYCIYDFSGQTLVPAVAAFWAQNAAVSFKTIPSDAAVVVKSGENEVAVNAAHSAYDLAAGEYSYTVSRSGYQTKMGSFTVTDAEAASHAQKTIHVSLVSSGSGSGSGSSDAKSYTVTVRVMVPPADQSKRYTYKHDSRSYTNLLTTTGKVTVTAGSSVRDAFVTILDQNGIDYVEQNNGYFPTIGGWSEYDRGANSGWMYRVNGSVPSVALKDYELTGNATIVWYYTDDYSNDYGSESWNDNSSSSSSSGTTTTPTTPANPVPDKTMPFTDVKSNDWYYQSVQYAYDNGLFSGVSHDSFAPGDSMDRSMLVTVLHSLDGKPAAGKGGFTDVADGAWYANAVAWAAEHGIVSGVSDSAFAPNGAITREQLAVMLYRYAQYKGYDVSKTADLSGYADQGSISDWAAQAVQWACGSGLMTGRSANSLAPAGTLTRAEAATMLKAFCENVKK